MMNDIVTCDMTNKVVLSLEEFLKLNDEVNTIKNKYENLINYLLSECDLVNYDNGNKDLQYDRYNNHLVEYLQKIEPDKYKEHIEYLINRGEKE